MIRSLDMVLVWGKNFQDSTPTWSGANIEFQLMRGDKMSKKKEVYMTVIKGAFVTIPEKTKEPTGKMLLKVKTEGGEDLVGLLFDTVQSIDSCLSALERIRGEFSTTDKLHPGMSKDPHPKTH